jgi:hypothetical protein
MPTFLQPEPPRQDLADPALTTLHRPSSSDEPTDHQRPDDGPVFGSGSASDVKGDNAPPMAGRSPASTADPVRVRPLLTTQQIVAGRALAESILMGATALLNRRTRVFPEDERWLMTKQERTAIAAPLGRIVARRSPIPSGGDGGDATDLADGVEAVVALVAYVIGQMTTERPDVPAYVPPAPQETPEPAGPGAQLSPFDPAYKVG